MSGKILPFASTVTTLQPTPLKTYNLKSYERDLRNVENIPPKRLQEIKDLIKKEMNIPKYYDLIFAKKGNVIVDGENGQKLINVLAKSPRNDKNNPLDGVWLQLLFPSGTSFKLGVHGEIAIKSDEQKKFVPQLLNSTNRHSGQNPYFAATLPDSSLLFVTKAERGSYDSNNPNKGFYIYQIDKNGNIEELEIKDVSRQYPNPPVSTSLYHVDYRTNQQTTILFKGKDSKEHKLEIPYYPEQPTLNAEKIAPFYEKNVEPSRTNPQQVTKEGNKKLLPQDVVAKVKESIFSQDKIISKENESSQEPKLMTVEEVMKELKDKNATDPNNLVVLALHTKTKAMYDTKDTFAVVKLKSVTKEESTGTLFVQFSESSDTYGEQLKANSISATLYRNIIGAYVNDSSNEPHICRVRAISVIPLKQEKK